MEKIIATYVKKQIKNIDAENPFDATKRAEELCPEGYELLDWEYAEDNEHPDDFKEYLKDHQ